MRYKRCMLSKWRGCCKQMEADFEKGTKVCSHCKRELPISESYKNRGAVDGLSSYCRKCSRKAKLKYERTEKGKDAKKKERDRRINTFGRLKKECGRGVGRILKGIMN